MINHEYPDNTIFNTEDINKEKQDKIIIIIMGNRKIFYKEKQDKPENYNLISNVLRL